MTFEMKSQLRSTLLNVLSLCFLLLLSSIKNAHADRKKDLGSRAQNLEVSATAARTAITELSVFFIQQVEEATDQITKKNKNANIRLNAIQWKTNITPNILKAAQYRDLIIAAADLLCLAIQQREFFSQGNGKNLFGPQQEFAIAASKRIEKEIIATYNQLTKTGNIPNMETTVVAWANEHPIESLTFHRRSIIEPLSRKLQDTSGGGGMKSVRGMEDTLEDLVARIDELQFVLPKQIRWEVDLMTTNLTQGKPINDSLKDLSSLSNSFDEIASFASNASSFTQDQMNTLFQAVKTERQATIQQVEDTVQRSIDHAFKRAVQLVMVIFVLILGILWIRNKINQKI
jgi:hypothetical protein